MLRPKKLIFKNSEFKNNSRTSMKKGFSQIQFQYCTITKSRTIQGIQGLGSLNLLQTLFPVI